MLVRHFGCAFLQSWPVPAVLRARVKLGEWRWVLAVELFDAKASDSHFEQ